MLTIILLFFCSIIIYNYFMTVNVTSYQINQINSRNELGLVDGLVERIHSLVYLKIVLSISFKLNLSF